MRRDWSAEEHKVDDPAWPSCDGQLAHLRGASKFLGFARLDRPSERRQPHRQRVARVRLEGRQRRLALTVGDLGDGGGFSGRESAPVRLACRETTAVGRCRDIPSNCDGGSTA
jgi:hypothetical protein